MGDTVYQEKGLPLNGKAKGKKLIIIDSAGDVREISLDSFRKDRLLLGNASNPQNDIAINCPFVSRQHGKLKISQDRLLYADLGSMNGTYIENDGYRKFLQGNKHYVELVKGGMLRICPADKSRFSDSVLILYADGSEDGKWNSFPLIAATTRIGRDVNNDIVLSHPAISRYHAQINRAKDHFELIDKNSHNGVYVNGRKVSGSKALEEKDVISIANHTLIFAEGKIFYKNSAQGINIEVRNMNKFVDRGRRQILNSVNCRIESNEFVAIIGGSGAGKTTLMNAISGFDRKVEGEVLFNGVDVHRHFNDLKDLIGYVPQEDIIYDNLTLRDMLWYTARLKMPKDASKDEILNRIDQVLGMVELQEHADKFIRKLSGGQKKRASIAVEMLGDPSVFFLDEPTSGLDPGTEQNLMITLNKLSKSQGKTIIMVTHTTQSLQLCDRVIFMGKNGWLCFAGTTEQAKMFFGTDDLVDIYHKINDEAEFWAEQYQQAVIDEDKAAVFSETTSEKPDKKQKGLSLFQLPVLTIRYFKLICNDMQRLLMLFAQPVGIAFLLVIVANKKAFFMSGDTQNILFCLSCAAIWIGLFNSIQEICKERAILKREYMGNLRLPYYVLSKFFVQTIVGFLQSLLLTLIFVLMIGRPIEGILFSHPFPEMLISVWMTIEASMALGFVISSLVKNTDRAMTFAPFVLIIQLLFSGILFKLKGMGKYIAYVTVSKWSMEALGSTSVLNDLPTGLQRSFANMGRTADAIYRATVPHLLMVWGILAGMMLLCGIVCRILLRQVAKDGR